MRILILNGPNLNFLGRREPHIYGSLSLASIEQTLRSEWEPQGIKLSFFQSNHEGDLIDRIQQAWQQEDGIVINPGGLTHTSVSLRDAIAAVAIPTVEVHISNVHSRESFRHVSFIAPVALGQIIGFGAEGYSLAVRGLISHLKQSIIK